jgi:hypothetical protein
MKYFLLSLCLFVFTLSFTSKKNKAKIDDDKCKAILDSAYILAGYGNITINWKLHKIDEGIQKRIVKWLEERTYTELTCLLESDNKLFQFYGYAFASKQENSNLKEKYLNIYNDTTAIQLITEGKLVDSKMTIGRILQGISEQKSKDNDNMKRKPEIEKKVTLFIKKYSKYPQTYKPISFLSFSVGSQSDGSYTFNIRHKYQIKNNKGLKEKIISAFIFDSSLNIQAIEKDSSLIISAQPPKIEDWLKKYGRKITEKDRTILKLSYIPLDEDDRLIPYQQIED